TLEISRPLPANPYGQMPAETFADLCRTVVELMVGQQFLLLLLVTPAFAAGSVSDEKTRGTLQEWLTTDLSAWEILRGKLLAQLIQVGTLALPALPLLAFFSVFGGMSFLALAVLAWTILLQLVGLSAASLLASVWCQRTTTAVLNVYLAGAVAFAAAWFFGLERYVQPLYLLD